MEIVKIHISSLLRKKLCFFPNHPKSQSYSEVNIQIVGMMYKPIIEFRVSTDDGHTLKQTLLFDGMHDKVLMTNSIVLVLTKGYSIYHLC